MNPCGTNCEECQFRSPCACQGCGTPFYGTCPVADCVREKEHPNCAQCGSFPCEKLNSAAFDPFTGDGGKRIEALKKARS